MLKTSLVEKTSYAENGEKNGDIMGYNEDIFLLLDKNSFATSHSKKLFVTACTTFLKTNSNSIGGVL